jgi:hypothetical protein
MMVYRLENSDTVKFRNKEEVQRRRVSMNLEISLLCVSTSRYFIMHLPGLML